MKEKVTIKRGTPQETLMFPLYGRYKANQMYPQLFKDVTAKEIISRIDYDIEQSDMGKGPQFVYGMRQDVAAFGQMSAVPSGPTEPRTSSL